MTGSAHAHGRTSHVARTQQRDFVAFERDDISGITIHGDVWTNSNEDVHFHTTSHI